MQLLPLERNGYPAKVKTTLKFYTNNSNLIPVGNLTRVRGAQHPQFKTCPTASEVGITIHKLNSDTLAAASRTADV